MTRLTWDDTGNRIYETGTKQGVLFRKQTVGNWYENGVAWNGLTAVSESPSGAEETALYADDVKYLSLRSNEEFGATLEAYTYPDEWAECDGSAELGAVGSGVYIGQQTRRGFSLAYVTTIGNDQAGNDYGHKLHLIYNAMASPSEKSYATINDSPEAITFSWELTTTPIKMPKVNGKQLKNSATIIIDSTKLPAAKMDQIEDMVFGFDAYKEVVSPTGNPSALGYYIKNTAYASSTDASVVSGTKYYEIAYREVTPDGNANPSQLGYYILSQGEYSVTEDTTVQSGTQYYEQYYKEVTPAQNANPSQLHYYVLNGAEYIMAVDTTVQGGTTYYEIDPDNGKPTLPTPEQVLAIVNGNN